MLIEFRWLTQEIIFEVVLIEFRWLTQEIVYEVVLTEFRWLTQDFFYETMFTKQGQPVKEFVKLWFIAYLF